MDFATILSAISTVGFPIAACCVMFWYMNKERESHTQETQQLTNAIADLRETIATNTALLSTLIQKVGDDN